MLNKGMALLALRYALTRDSQAADIVYKWYSENIDLFTKQELITLMEFRSDSTITTQKSYLKKKDVWDKWLKLIHDKWKSL